MEITIQSKKHGNKIVLIDAEDFENKIEHAFWYFNDKLSKKNFSDRDCFKQTLRHYFKEKPMENKVIFESEEEAIKQFELCIGYDYQDKNKDVEKLNRYIEKCIHHGYIRKSPVEEAEEMYKSWHFKWGINNLSDLCTKQHEAIQYLKSENERLGAISKPPRSI